MPVEPLVQLLHEHTFKNHVNATVTLS